MRPHRLPTRRSVHRRFALVAAMSVPLLLGLGGCAGMPLVDPSVTVNRTHSLPEKPVARAFVVLPMDRGQSADPVFGTAANMVAAQLTQWGHQWRSGYNANASWVVTLDTALIPARPAGPATVSPNVTYGFGWGSSGRIEPAAGAGVNIESGPPGTFVKRLTVTIRENGRTVWDGRAVIVDESQDLMGALGALGRALFSRFPGPQGVEQS